MDLSIKVLVVDDFATMRRILKGALKQMGTDVAVAATYLDARAVHARGIPSTGLVVPIGAIDFTERVLSLLADVF